MTIDHLAVNNKADPAWDMGGSTIDPTTKEKILEYIRQGAGITKACKLAGLSLRVMRGYRDRHPEFEEEVRRAEGEACEIVECALMKKIIDDKHFPAMVFWLLNRAGGRWKDNRGFVIAGNAKTVDSEKADEIIMNEILDRLEPKLKKKSA